MAEWTQTIVTLVGGLLAIGFWAGRAYERVHCLHDERRNRLSELAPPSDPNVTKRVRSSNSSTA